MKKVNMVTLSAAVSHLGGKSVNLADVQALVKGPDRVKRQGWSFRGNWKQSVAPFFHN